MSKLNNMLRCGVLVGTIATNPFSITKGQNIEPKKRMNILFLQSDQHRYDCIGYSGTRMVKTPNLDKLADESVQFMNSYSCIPTSCPARQSLLTGKWPEQHKGLWNYDITLPVSPFQGPTWTEELGQSDIKLGYVGKWHVHPQKTPLDYGFDDNVNEYEYNKWRKQEGLPDYVWQDSAWVMGGYDPVDKKQSRTHWLAQKAIDIIKKYNAEGKTWHIRLDHPDPHLPCYPVKEYLDMYDAKKIPEWGNFKDEFENKPYIQKQMTHNWRLENRGWDSWQGYLQRYYANITQLDDALGMVIQALKDMGIYDETIIVYTSDHGDSGGCHRMIDKHYVMYEEVVHVPLLVRIPGVKSRKVTEFVNNQLDMAATMCDIYGLSHQTQGQSLMPFIDSTDSTQINWRQYAFSNYNGQQYGLFVQRMIRDKQFKYVWTMTDVDELYDLENDPWENKNLIYDPNYTKELQRLRKALYEDLKQRKDQVIWQDATKRQLLEGVKL